MTSEVSNPRTPAGSELSELLRKMWKEAANGLSISSSDLTTAVAYLDKTLEQVRADERSLLFEQLHQVAEDGLEKHRVLVNALGHILNEAASSDEVRDQLINLHSQEMWKRQA